MSSSNLAKVKTCDPSSPQSYVSVIPYRVSDGYYSSNPYDFSIEGLENIFPKRYGLDLQLPFTDFSNPTQTPIFSCSGMHLFGGNEFASIGIKHEVDLQDMTTFSFAFALDQPDAATKHQVCFRVHAVQGKVSNVHIKRSTFLLSRLTLEYDKDYCFDLVGGPGDFVVKDTQLQVYQYTEENPIRKYRLRIDQIKNLIS